jgi:uncharacterized protein YbjQ (UPF0145 family)
MRSKLAIVVAVLAFAAAGPAAARDDKGMYPIKAALEKGKSFKDKVESDIPLYFGKQRTPAVDKRMGEWTSNKKTNAFGKTDQEACEVAFISAAIALQQRARREGGNAVINIRSVYKNDDVESEREYLCGAGAVMAGVALKGTVVTLKQGRK